MERKARILIGRRVERKRKPTIAWKEWEKKEGRYPVVYIFYPRRYPSYTVVFETEDCMVRRSMQKEVMKELKKAGWDYRKDNLYMVIEQDGYYLEWQEGTGYEKKEYGLRRKRQEEMAEEEELDIEF